MSAWAQAAWIVKKMRIPDLMLQYQDRYDTLVDKITSTNNEIQILKNKIKTFSAGSIVVSGKTIPAISGYNPNNYIDGAIWLIQDGG